MVLPEELFDMDCPGHYYRRIKLVSMSIPVSLDPTPVLTALSQCSRYRAHKFASFEDEITSAGADDNRFSDHFGSLEAIVTSIGQNDSGFESKPGDERYGPFEGSGVISEWQVELPSEVRQIDYNTIADVILHLRYTAREGGSPLKSGAVKNLKDKIEGAKAAGSVRLFSIRHDFPTEWAQFKAIKFDNQTKTATVSINLREEHYPFWSKGRLGSIKRIDLFARTTQNAIDIFAKADGIGDKTTLSKSALFGDLCVACDPSLPADGRLRSTFR